MHYFKKVFVRLSLCLIVIIAIAISPALSQNEYLSVPQSFTHKETIGKSKSIIIAPNQNVEDIKARQAWSNSNIQTKPLTVGLIVPQTIDFIQEAETITLDNGKKIYRLDLRGEEAKGIILYYDQFEIPQGGKLFLYSKDKSVLHGAYTEETNPTRSHFATSPIMSEHIVMEYEPGNKDNQGPHIIISDVGYLFSQATSDFQNNSKKEIIDGEDTSMPNCQINANCPEASHWRKQMAGVCQIYLTMIRDGKKYISACSGTLINNTKEDYTPLIISAAHCMEDIMKQDNYEEYLDQWIFNFHYMKPGCSNSPSGYGRQVKSMIGCDILSYLPFDGHSDGILLKLKEDIPASYRVFYNGWDRRDRLYKSAISLHHPSGDAMKISFHDGEPQIFKADHGAENAHFKLHFTKGDTEGGSSGSGLFNENGLLVGTLTGGGPGVCFKESVNYYGRLTAHWDWFKGEDQLIYKGKDLSSMQKYLDPLGSQIETLEGVFRDKMYPLSPSERLDATIMKDGGTILLSWKAPYGSDKFEYKGIKYFLYRDGEQIATIENDLTYEDKVTTDFFRHNKIDYSIRVAYPSTDTKGDIEYTLSAKQTASIYVGKLSMETEAKKEIIDEGVQINWKTPIVNQLVSKVNPNNNYELDEIAIHEVIDSKYTIPQLLLFREKCPIQSPLYKEINGIESDRLYVKQMNFVPSSNAKSIRILVMLNDWLEKKHLQTVKIPANHPAKTWINAPLKKPFEIDKNQLLYIGFGTDNKDGSSSICKYKGSDEILFDYYYPYVEVLLGKRHPGLSGPAVQYWTALENLEEYGYHKEHDLMAISYVVSNDPTPLKKPLSIDETIYTGAFPINAPKPIGYKINKNGKEIASVEHNIFSYIDKDGTENDIYTVDPIYGYNTTIVGNITVNANQDTPSIYPSIAKDHIHVRYSGPLRKVAIYDLSGRMVKNWGTPKDKYFYVSELPSGQYIIVVQTKETAYPMKFIKE